MQVAPVAVSQNPGMVPMQTTVQSTSVPQKLIDKQNEIQNRALTAQDDLVKAQVEQNKLLAEHAKSQAIEAENANMRAATQQAYDAEQQRAKEAELQKALDDYNANKQVDPDRYKKRMGVGGQILATIGQAMGAFGAAITHSPNYAQQMIERAIDADIRAQEVDIQSRRDAVNMAQNGVAMWRQKGLDNQASMAAERMRQLQGATAKIDEILTATKNPQLLATGAQIKAGLEKSYNDTLMHYGQTSRSTVSATPQPGQQGTENQLRMRALEVEVPQKDPKTGKELPPRTILAKSPQDAEKVRDAITVSRQIKRNLAEMRDLVSNTSQSISPKAKAMVEAKDKELRTQFAVLHHLGALSDQDYKIAGQIGDPTSLFQRDSTTLELIGQYESSLDGMVEGELRGRGLLR
jgi:hypothetical protein